MTEGFFSFLPPEMAKALQRQNDQQVMLAEAEQLAVEHFLDNISPEDMATLRGIFHDLVSDSDGRLAAYYEGICVTILRVKYGKCPGCGKDRHDTPESLLDADSGKESDPVAPDVDDDAILKSPGPLGEESLFANPDAAHNPQPLPGAYVDMSQELIGQTGMLPTSLVEKMQEYDMDDLRDEDTGVILGFICTRCQMRYASIEDRMKRAPDECDGCFQKARWG